MTRRAAWLWISALVVGAFFIATTIEKGLGRALSAPDTLVDIVWEAGWLLSLGVFSLVWWSFKRFRCEDAVGPLLLWSGLIAFVGLFSFLGASMGP